MVAQLQVDFIPTLKIMAASFLAWADDLEVRSLREPLKQSIQEVVAPSFVENFVVGGRPSWTPLSDATEQRSDTDQPLVRTGKLKKRAGQLALWTISGVAGEATADNLGNAPYGTFIQSGTRFMPAREWAVLQPEDEDHIVEVFDRYIVGRFEARFS